ncbi:50S ribosomal protein L32 [Candidatus Marinimicrobia bacterium]|jgi:large subunit ribosomal protein L32|nr:50S ribosomal protein L32 [Candidatus Neomarinimicrobiota bacterium]|tara:strand:- start:163 stop:348 length:186 start_codon:yes stop_codon:yes gene_type:complete
MAVPKRKQSKSRSRKRKAQWKMNDSSCLSTCPQTETTHLRHHAYMVDGVLYYKGKILVKNS